MLKKLNYFALLMTVCMGSLFADLIQDDGLQDGQLFGHQDGQLLGHNEGQFNSHYDDGLLNDQCCDVDCSGRWRVWGEYLCFKPSIDDSYFVIDSPINTGFPNGKRKNNDFGFHSGYRVGGAYTFCDCCRELLVSYAQLDFTRCKVLRGEHLWATQGTPIFAAFFQNYDGLATSDLKFRYHRVDALYSQCLYSCCGFDFGIQFGLEAAYIRLRESFIYQRVTGLGDVRQHTRTSGVGPQIGVALGYQLFQCGDQCNPSTLKLNVFASGSMLAGDSKSKERNDMTSFQALHTSDRTSWRVIPALHTRVGLNYSKCISRFNTAIEVGYEFSSYLRALSRTMYTDSFAGGPSFNRFDNVDLQGLYVAISVGF